MKISALLIYIVQEKYRIFVKLRKLTKIIYIYYFFFPFQAALGIQDLGQLYYLPLKDSEGTTVLCTVKHVKDPKTMVTLSVRWMPLYKVQRKRLNNSDSNGENPGVNDLLLDSLQVSKL